MGNAKVAKQTDSINVNVHKSTDSFAAEEKQPFQLCLRLQNKILFASMYHHKHAISIIKKQDSKNKENYDSALVKTVILADSTILFRNTKMNGTEETSLHECISKCVE